MKNSIQTTVQASQTKKYIMIGVGIITAIVAKDLISKFNKSKEQKKKQAKQKNDPFLFKEKVQQEANKLVLQLSKLNIQSQIAKQPNQKDVAFFGASCSGKSSLINKLYNLKLAVGLSQTTQLVQQVHQYKNIRIWDTVGQTQAYQYFDIKKLLFIHDMDIIFILYRDQIKPIQFMVKLICFRQNSKTKVYFVRTQCDQWSDSHNKSIDEEIIQDQKILQGYGVKNPLILKSSAKEQYSKLFINQNQKILKLIEQKE